MICFSLVFVFKICRLLITILYFKTVQDMFKDAVLGIWSRMQIRMFLGPLDQDLLARGLDPDLTPNPDPSLFS